MNRKERSLKEQDRIHNYETGHELLNSRKCEFEQKTIRVYDYDIP